MSLSAYTAVWNNLRNLPPSSKVMMLAIADYAGEDGWCYPGVESLAAMAGISWRHAVRVLAALEKAGHLMILDRASKYGTNMYGIMCVTKGKFNPPRNSQREKDLDDARKNHPAKTTPDKMSPHDKMSCAKDERQMSPEPLVTTVVVAEGAVEWPSEQETLDHGRKYPGNLSKAIPAGIPDAWVKGYWAWKTYDLCKWSPKWRDEMYWRFEGNYQEGRANTRHNPSGQFGDQGQNKTADDFAIEAQLREYERKHGAA